MNAGRSISRFKLLAIMLFSAALLAVTTSSAFADEVALEEQAGPPPTPISTVYIDNVSLYAEDGQFIPFTGTVPEGAHYSIKEECWSTSDGPISSMYEDGAGCDAGHPMFYAVILDADADYQFASNVKLVINGKKVSAAPFTGADSLGPYYHFLNPPYYSRVGFFDLATAPTPSNWTRLWGQTALDTTQAIVQKGWAPGNTDTVVLATMSGYYDALAAAPLAGIHEAPIILTNKTTLSPQALAEIQRLNVDTVIIVGGPAAVSQGIEDKLKGMGYDVDRFSGEKAIDTANDIAKEVNRLQPATVCIVATSKSYHDALAIAPLAWRYGIPIYLTNAKGELSDSTLQAMKDQHVGLAVIMGGNAAVPQATEDKIKTGLGASTVIRLEGETAIETAIQAADFSNVLGSMDFDGMGIATAGGYHDALAGAALCGKNNAVMLLVPKVGAKTPNFSALDYLEARADSSTWGYVFGGPAAVSNETIALAAMALNSPVG